MSDQTASDSSTHASDEPVSSRDASCARASCCSPTRRRPPVAGIIGVLTITHSSPDPEHPGGAIELPATVKTRLGLNRAPSWIIVSEFNRFIWPESGYDLETLPDGRGSHGALSLGAFATVKAAVRELHRRRRFAGVNRDG